MLDLQTKTVKELLEIHDSTVPEDRRLGKWRRDRRKAELIELCERALADQDELSDPPETEGFTDELHGVPKGRTIKETAIRALSVIVDHDDAGRPVGLPYAEVLRIVHAHHPDAKTRVEILRWYRKKMNEGDANHPVLNEERRLPVLGEHA